MALLENERKVAESAVLRAALLTKAVQDSVKELPKEDSTPVTIADFAAQALIISAIHDAFPGDDFLGEEDSQALRDDADLREKVYKLVSTARSYQGEELVSPKSEDEMLQMIDRGGSGKGGRSGRFWVMDPVDGTATFLRGEQYAVSLALMEDGKQVMGVLACPNLKLTTEGRVQETSVDSSGLGILLTGIKGQGVWARYPSPDGKDVRPAVKLERLTSPSNTKDYHIVDTSTSSSTRMDVSKKVADAIGATYPGTDVWSSHMRYATLVMGGADFFVRVPVSGRKAKSYIWDHAGAQLIVTELGGKITDLDGKDIDFSTGRDLDNNRGLVAARGDAYDAVFETVKQTIEE